MKKIIITILFVAVLSGTGWGATHNCGTVLNNVYRACMGTIDSNGETSTVNLPADARKIYCQVTQDVGGNDKIIRVLLGKYDMTPASYTGGVAFINSGMLQFILQADPITETFFVPRQRGDIIRVRGIKGFGVGNSINIDCYLYRRIW